MEIINKKPIKNPKMDELTNINNKNENNKDKLTKRLINKKKKKSSSDKFNKRSRRLSN